MVGFTVPEPDSTLRAHFTAELLMTRHGVLTGGRRRRGRARRIRNDV